jgi:class 3 adenylate cyclase
MIIHNALLTDFGLQSKIGGTYGKAYCGVVGGVKRHEYAVLGKSVNLSARLMMSEVNPRIIVDDEVRLKTEETFHFRPLPAVFAKGYASLVPIFEPLGTRKRKFERFFVGRSSDIDQILKLLANI